MIRLGAVAWSILVWVALWSTLSVANVLWGAVIGLVLLRVVPVTISEEGATISPIGALRWAGYLLWSLVESSAVVAWEVITPGDKLNQGIVAVPLRTTSDVVATVVANSITLTPGAMTLEVARHPHVLYVHVMHLRSIEEIRDDVAELEDRVLAMFPRAAAAPTAPSVASVHAEESDR